MAERRESVAEREGDRGRRAIERPAYVIVTPGQDVAPQGPSVFERAASGDATSAPTMSPGEAGRAGLRRDLQPLLDLAGKLSPATYAASQAPTVEGAQRVARAAGALSPINAIINEASPPVVTHVPSPGAPAEGPMVPGGVSPGDLALPAGPPMAAPGAPGMVATGGGGAAPRIEERDRLGPQQRAALNALRQGEAQYAAHGAEPFQQVLAQEEALGYAQQQRAEASARGAERRAVEQAAELEARQRDFDKAAAEIADTKIDPGRWMASKSTFQKVAGFVGQALGGFLQGVRGGPNPVEDMIQREEDRDIDAQKFAYNAKRDSLAAKQTAFGQAMARFQDARAAEAVARAAFKDAVLATGAQLAARQKSAEVSDRFEQLKIGLLGKRAQDAQQFLAYGPTGGGGGAAPHLPSLDEGKLVQGLDGQSYYVPEGKALREKAAAIADIQSDIDEALRIRKGASKLDLLNPYSEVTKRLKSLQADVDRKGTVYGGQGAMSAGDRVVSQDASGAMLGLTEANDKVLAASRDRYAREFQHALQAQSAQPVQVVMVPNPKTGLLERRAIPSGQTYSVPRPAPLPASFAPAGAKR